jgi:hypothetical protein
MSEVFATISQLVSGELQGIINENENKRRENQLAGIEEEENYAEEINQKDFLIDFANDDFINKNIRVRPVSGVTVGERDEQKSEVMGAGNRFLADGSNQIDEDKKFDDSCNIEMEIQRRTVKQMKIDYELEIIKKEEKLAK